MIKELIKSKEYAYFFDNLIYKYEAGNNIDCTTY